ncbi:hypothetical protein ABKN59_001670 [Abortiporus biennis]
MEQEIQQLVEMGASRAQAKAALKKHKDVMEAAERIFDGSFDDVVDDDGDVDMQSTQPGSSKKQRIATPDDDEEEEEGEDAEMEENEDEEEDDEDDVADYYSDSDFEPQTDSGTGVATADPYAGIFFSKDRREEVIEVEEEPETVFVPDANETVHVMTQGQWMKGCPEGGEQSFLFSLYQELTYGECRCPNGCPTSIKRQKRDFFALFSDFSTYISHLQRIVVRNCPACSKPFCFACGESITAESHHKTSSESEDNDCLFHCANLQGVILGVGLAMLEQTFLQESTNATPVALKSKIDGFMSVIQTKKKKLGVGYAGDAREDNSGQLEAQAVQRAKDEKLSQLLANIRVYLPNLHREGGGKPNDYLPHPTTLAHLRRRFNFICSQLLRNDSLTDMSDRSVLYFELFEWLETISNHEALASMMAMPIMVVTSVKTITSKKSSNNKSAIRERTIIYEGSSGPRELLEAIVIQAQAALKGLEATAKKEDNMSEDNMTEEQKRMTVDSNGKGKAKDLDGSGALTEENMKLSGFCKRILGTAKAIDRSLRDTKGVRFVERLHASLPKIPGTSGSGSGNTNQDIVVAGDSEESVQKAYIEWANRVRFEYCDLTIPSEKVDAGDDTPHFKFFYNNEARMLANSDIPKRSLAIAKELAVLTTNLPVAWNSSVFLRVDETRVDVIKALITGPEGTPYYNGCYLFDIFLGPSYNHAPPNVKYMTTNGGKYRFNPNLYADGKVCLSLLGTWSGPGWIAGKSTLLQVLISIQSMILCEEPYLNEPGWANSAGTAESKAYSANVRRMVVKTAMLDNLKNPPEPFEDVIRTHFRLKARSICTQLDSWLQLDDGKATNADGAYAAQKTSRSVPDNGLGQDVEELKDLLGKLSRGESILNTTATSS